MHCLVCYKPIQAQYDALLLVVVIRHVSSHTTTQINVQNVMWLINMQMKMW